MTNYQNQIAMLYDDIRKLESQLTASQSICGELAGALEGCKNFIEYIRVDCEDTVHTVLETKHNSLVTVTPVINSINKALSKYNKRGS